MKRIAGLWGGKTPSVSGIDPLSYLGSPEATARPRKSRSPPRCSRRSSACQADALPLRGYPHFPLHMQWFAIGPLTSSPT